jgi:hypothetical protein
MHVDPLVESSVREKFMSGNMSYMIPFQYGWRNSSMPGEAAITLQLTNGFGSHLKRILHAPFDSSDATNLAYDHQNLNGSKISSYQTMLNGAPLQDSKLSCGQPIVGGSIQMDDFRENRERLVGSALNNSLAYYMNWVHIDSWSTPKRDGPVPEENIIEGLSLALPQQWSINATTLKPLAHFTWGEFTRRVVSSPTGLTVIKV